MAVMRRAALLPFFALLVPAVLTLGACRTGQSIAPVESAPQGFARWEDAVPTYRLGPGDRFQVRFLLLPEMDEEGLVGPDGSVMLRGTGAIAAAGLTPAELASIVQERSKRWVRDPQVSVTLRETTSNRVYVGGSVARPGPYVMTGRMGSLEGILLAGGFDREARYEEVVLIRRNPDNKPMLRTIDLRGFIEKGYVDGDVPLAAGDILFVPRSSIAELNLWIEQFIDRVLPFERTFNYTIGRQRSYPYSSNFPP